MNKLVEVLSRNPVRVYLYSVLLAVLALLVGLGVLTATVSGLVAAVGAALFAVPAVAAVEVARAKVTPVKTLESTSNPEGERVAWGPERPVSELERTYLEEVELTENK